jgi:hypothetical protein
MGTKSRETIYGSSIRASAGSAQLRGGKSMIRFLAAILFSTLVMQMPVSAQQPATTSATDYVLVTVVLRHDQSRNLEEITKLLDESGF